MAHTREVEICTETLQACEAARDGGADRIELCSALAEGGVTPSRGLLKQALKLDEPPIHVLLRPRAGNFIYSKAEFDAICDDLKLALDLGAAGVVFGSLLPNGSVDAEQVGKLVEQADGKPVTFHRAFDRANNLAEALEIILSCGCQRILTSGGRPTVTEGLPILHELVRIAAGRIRIAAGGGVTLQNVQTLAKVSELDIHASLRQAKTGLEVKDVLWNDLHPTGQQIMAEDVRMLCDIFRTEVSR